MITFDIFYLGANSLGGGITRAPNNLQSLTFPDRWQSSIVQAPTEKLWAKFIFILSVFVSMQSRLQGIQHLLFPPATLHSKTIARNFPSFFRYTHGYVFALGVFGRIFFPIRLFFLFDRVSPRMFKWPYSMLYTQVCKWWQTALRLLCLLWFAFPWRDDYLLQDKYPWGVGGLGY
jgi:hypothetical protein